MRIVMTGQVVGVGSGQPAESNAGACTRADVIDAADAVIARHIEVIRKLARR